MMKLYVYDHCPFCVRARMIFGLKNLPFEKIVLANDDEKTPIDLVGKKVVPILIKEDSTAMPESLDIVAYVDASNSEKVLSDGEIRSALQDWMQQVGAYYNHLLSPRFVKLGLAEFKQQSAVDYFVSKKTEYVGDFAQNIANSGQYITKINADLCDLEALIVSDNAVSGQLSLEDICLFPMLRNLTCVKGVQFPAKVLGYLEKMAQLSQIDLFTDRAI